MDSQALTTWDLVGHPVTDEVLQTGSILGYACRASKTCVGHCSRQRMHASTCTLFGTLRGRGVDPLQTTNNAHSWQRCYVLIVSSVDNVYVVAHTACIGVVVRAHAHRFFVIDWYLQVPTSGGSVPRLGCQDQGRTPENGSCNGTHVGGEDTSSYRRSPTPGACAAHPPTLSGPVLCCDDDFVLCIMRGQLAVTATTTAPQWMLYFVQYVLCDVCRDVCRDDTYCSWPNVKRRSAKYTWRFVRAPVCMYVLLSVCDWPVGCVVVRTGGMRTSFMCCMTVNTLCCVLWPIVFSDA